MYYRELKLKIPNEKILVLLGPRQVGKTTLVKSAIKEKFLLREFNLDLEEDKRYFDKSSRTKINTLILSMKEEGQSVLFIDEVQKNLACFDFVKYVYDHFKEIQIVITGSTALELQKNSFETLAGRATYKRLLGLSPEEIFHQINSLDTKQASFVSNLKVSGADEILNRTLLYGSYPKVYFAEDPVESLESLANNIVLRDFIVSQANESKLKHLIKLLALQTSSQISIEELSSLTEISKPTVYEYLDQLEKLYIIHRSEPLDLSSRKAISRGSKVYFWDLGLRNYFAGNFMGFDERPDKGAIFENFVVNNFKRKNIYQNLRQTIGYFRNVNQSEIDIVIKNYDDTEEVYECKLTKDSDQIHSKLLDKAIPCISRYNWMDYL